MTYRGPELLSGDHLVAGFDCEKPALNDWLTHRALTNQGAGTSRTWVVVDEASGRVVAFYASSASSILRERVTGRFARNQPEEIPAVLLGRMAVDSKHKGFGLGAALLKHFLMKALEVAESVGVRLVLVHAMDEEAKSFYKHYGFTESKFDDLTLLLLLPDLSR